MRTLFSYLQHHQQKHRRYSNCTIDSGEIDLEEGKKMKIKLLIATATLLSLLVLAMPAMSHHSFMAEFDMSKAIVVKGVLTDIQWANPHITFYVDVMDEYGSVTHWGINAAAPSAFVGRGLTRSLLKPGDAVVVEGFPARNGKAFAAGSTLTLPDGRRFFIGSDGATLR